MSEKEVNKLKTKSIIGNSSNATLRAAKTLVIPKAVYRLGNIDSVYSVEHIQDYITSLGVRVLTCFELPKALCQPAGNKSFCVCIIAEDKPKLLDTSNWSVGVSLRKWHHKPNRDGVTGSEGGTVGMGIVTGGATGIIQPGIHDHSIITPTVYKRQLSQLHHTTFMVGTKVLYSWLICVILKR